MEQGCIGTYAVQLQLPQTALHSKTPVQAMKA
jgi:hypothetical protein